MVRCSVGAMAKYVKLVAPTRLHDLEIAARLQRDIQQMDIMAQLLHRPYQLINAFAMTGIAGMSWNWRNHQYFRHTCFYQAKAWFHQQVEQVIS